MPEEVGSLVARFTLDESSLKRSLKGAEAALKSWAKRNSPLEIETDLDNSGLNRGLSSATRTLTSWKKTHGRVGVRFDVDDRSLTAGLAKAAKKVQSFRQSASAKLNVDTAEAMRKVGSLSGRIESLRGTTVAVDVKATGLSGVVAGLERVQSSARDTGRTDADVRVSASGAGQTTTALGAVKQASDSLNGRNATVKVGETGAVATAAKVMAVGQAADRVDGRNVRLGFDASQLDILGRLNRGLGETASRMRSVATVGSVAAIPALIAGIAGIIPVATAAAAAVGGLVSGLGQGLAGAVAIGGGALASAYAGLATYASVAGLAVAGAREVAEGLTDARNAAEGAALGVGAARQALAQATPGTREYREANLALSEALKAQADAQRELLRLQTLNTPAARAFNAAIAGAIIPLTRIQAEIGNRVLPAFTRLIDLGLSRLPQLTPPLYRLVSGVTRVGEAFVRAQFSGSRLARLTGILDFIARSGIGAAKNLSLMGDTGLQTVRLLIPAMMRFQASLTGALARMNGWVQSSEGVKVLSTVFAGLEMRMNQTFAALGNLTMGMYGLFAAFGEAGLTDRMMSGFVNLTRRFREFTSAGSQGRAMLVSFSTAAQPTLNATWQLLGAVFTEWGRVANALIRARNEAGKLVVPEALNGIREALPAIGTLLISTFRSFGPMIGPLVSGIAGLLTSFIAFNPVLQRLTGFVVGALTAFNNLPGPIKTVIVSTVSLASVMGALGIGFLGVVGKVGMLAPALMGVTARLGITATAATATGAAGTAAGAGLMATVAPVALVVGGLALLAGGLYFAYQRSETFRKAVNWLARGFNDTQGASILWGGSLRRIREEMEKHPGKFSPIERGLVSLRTAFASSGKEGSLFSRRVQGIWADLSAPLNVEPAIGAINSLWRALAPKGSENQGRSLGQSLSALWKQVARPPDYSATIETINGVWKSLAPRGSDNRSRTLGQSLSDLWKDISRPADPSGTLETINSVWSALAPRDSGNRGRTLGQSLSTLWKEVSRPPDYGPAIAAMKAIGENARQMFRDLTKPPDFGPAREVINGFTANIGTKFRTAKENAIARTREMGADLISRWTNQSGESNTKFSQIAGFIGSNLLTGKTRAIARTTEMGADIIGRWRNQQGESDTKFSAIAKNIGTNLLTGKARAIARTAEMGSDIISRWLNQQRESGTKFSQIADNIGTNLRDARDRGTDRVRELGGNLNDSWANQLEAARGFGESFKRILGDKFGAAVNLARDWLSLLMGAAANVLELVGADKLAGSAQGLADQLGATRKFERGGVVEGYDRGGVAGVSAFADGGMGTPGKNPRMHLWNEQQGGEAFIAQKRPAKEQLPYLQTAADWHGYAVVPSRSALPKNFRHDDTTFKAGGVAGIPTIPFAIGGETASGGPAAMHSAVLQKFGVDGFNRHASYLSQPGASRSIDWMVTTPGNRASGSEKTLGDNIASFVAPPSTRATIWYGQANFGGGWQGYNTGPGMGNSNTLGHYDHVHAEALAESFKGAQGTSPGGGIGGFFSGVKDALGNAYNSVTDFISSKFKPPELPNFNLGIIGDGMAMLGKTILGKTKDFLISKATELMPGSDSGTPGSGTYKGGGNLKEWATNGLVLGNVFEPTATNVQKIMDRAMFESGGDPNAVNNYDINAQNGTPSKGLLQIIEGTWNANTTSQIGQFADNWNDPVKSVAVGSRYMKSRYGEVMGNTGIGYSRGGIIPGPDGKPVMIQAHAGERVLPREVTSSFDRLANSVALWSRKTEGSGSVAMDVGAGPNTEAVERQTRRMEAQLERLNANIEAQVRTQVESTVAAVMSAPHSSAWQDKLDRLLEAGLEDGDEYVAGATRGGR